jgi:hypothetical protein
MSVIFFYSRYKVGSSGQSEIARIAIGQHFLEKSNWLTQKCATAQNKNNWIQAVFVSKSRQTTA